MDKYEMFKKAHDNILAQIPHEETQFEPTDGANTGYTPMPQSPAPLPPKYEQPPAAQQSGSEQATGARSQKPAGSKKVTTEQVNPETGEKTVNVKVTEPAGQPTNQEQAGQQGGQAASSKLSWGAITNSMRNFISDRAQADVREKTDTTKRQMQLPNQYPGDAATAWLNNMYGQAATGAELIGNESPYTRSITGDPTRAQLYSNGVLEALDYDPEYVQNMSPQERARVLAYAKADLEQKRDQLGAGIQQHVNLMQTNPNYAQGFNGSEKHVGLAEDAFNNKEWQAADTNDKRLDYMQNQLADIAYSRAGAQMRDAAQSGDINRVPSSSAEEQLKQLFDDDVVFAEMESAARKGDPAFLRFMLEMQRSMGKEGADNMFSRVWEGLPKDKKDRLTAAMKSAVYYNLKQDFFGNLPKVISLWFHEKGWDTLGDFAEDPWKFYLSVAGILGGGALLLGGAFSGGGNQQPVVVNTQGGNANPLFNGESRFQ